jgi:hypothetical protein
MSWIHHPKFRKIRDEVLMALRHNEYKFRRVKKVVFLCGGRSSSARERLKTYLLERRNDVLIFYAEHVWSIIAKLTRHSALQLEAKLAELADLVLLIAESPGTFAELGAFSISDELRKKLLPLMDARYRGDDSFLNTGPIRWVDSESRFAPTIWTNLDAILESAGEIDSRLGRIAPLDLRVADLSTSPKHLLFFICDLVSIFGPCPASHIELYVESIVGKRIDSVPLLLALAHAIGLIESTLSAEQQSFYYRPLRDGALLAFHYTKKNLRLAQLRAEVLSVMQVIDSSKAALSLIRVK